MLSVIIAVSCMDSCCPTGSLGFAAGGSSMELSMERPMLMRASVTGVVIGDDDGDGVVDCDDRAGVLAHQFDPALPSSDPSHRAEFDADMDGDNDLDDRAIILRLIRAADWDANGWVNFFDYAGYLSAWVNSDPSADFDGDGDVDQDDLDAFMAEYSLGSCP